MQQQQAGEEGGATLPALPLRCIYKYKLKMQMDVRAKEPHSSSAGSECCQYFCVAPACRCACKSQLNQKKAKKSAHACVHVCVVRCYFPARALFTIISRDPEPKMMRRSSCRVCPCSSVTFLRKQKVLGAPKETEPMVLLAASP